MLTPAERVYTNVATAKVELEQFALDHGYSVNFSGSTVRCSRSGRPSHKVGARSEGPGRRASKTDCPFECALVKTASGVEVTVKHGDHNHDIDRNIGVKYWAVLTKEEKKAVKAMKLRDSSLQVGQVKGTINQVRAQRGLPALEDSKSISNLFQTLKKASGSILRSSPAHSSPSRCSPPRATRFGPAVAATDITTPEATVTLATTPAAATASSPLDSPSPSAPLDQEMQVASGDSQVEDLVDGLFDELNKLRPTLCALLASSSSSASPIDRADIARRGCEAMVGAMLCLRGQAP